MTTSSINRRTATVLTAALALGSAGPAAARQIGNDASVPVAPPMAVTHHAKANVPAPFAPRHANRFPQTTAAPVATATPRAVVTHPAPGGSSDLVYILVGGAVVALSGLGGTLVAANRRRTAPPRPRIAA